MACPPSSEKRKADQNRRQRQCRARKNTADTATQQNWVPEGPRPTPVILETLDELRCLAVHNTQLQELLVPYRHIGLKRWKRLKKLEAELKNDRGISYRSPLRRRQIETLRKRIGEIQRHIMRSKNFSITCEDISCYKAGMDRTPDAVKESYNCSVNHMTKSFPAELSRARTICGMGRQIVPLCLASIERAASRLLEQATRGVAHPLGTSKREKIFRTITRMKYHVVRPRTVDPDALPLSEIYPRIYRAFFNLPELMPALPSDENAVIDCMADLLASVANDNQEHQATFSYIPGPDEDNMECEQESMEIDEVPPSLVALGDDLLQEEPALRESAGPHGARLFVHIIRGKMCTETCTKMTVVEAEIIQQGILELVECIRNADYAAIERFQENVLPFMERYEQCFAGLRSLLARFRDLVAQVNTLLKIRKAMARSHSFAEEAMCSEDWQWMPKAIKDAVEPLFVGKELEKRHAESVALGRFGIFIDNFKKKIELLELKVCDLCNGYTMPDQMIMKTGYNLRDMARPRADGKIAENIVVCKKCLTDARSNKGTKANPSLPRLTLGNNVFFDEVPECLKSLNWFEQSLIQLVRPARNIFCLDDAGGRKTSMHAASGALVLLPVPTSGTLDHVATTLPSDANMTIIVHCESARDTKLVCLPRVLKALKWLVENHPSYAEVTINDSFVFTEESVIFVPKQPEDPEVVRQNLTTDDDQHPSLLRSAQIEPHIIRPVADKAPDGTGYETYLLQKSPYEPLKVDDKDLDCRTFPWHFPKGSGGFDCTRLKKLEKRMLIRWQLANVDRRIARDPHALAFLQGLLEQIDMTQALGLQVRLSRSLLDSDAFDVQLEAGNTEYQGSLHIAAKNMRGLMAYWRDVKQKVKAQIAVFGVPTFFVTLNPAEKSWPEVLQVYQAVFPGEKVTRDNIFEYISRDPFFFGRIFHRRVRMIFAEMFKKEGGPLGQVIHWFGRIEYQHRGTQHLHCMLWIKGAPESDATIQQRLDYIDAYITARLPDEVKEPELHRLITTHQMHYKDHSLTCLRTIKIGGKLETTCRFDMPRKVTARTILNPNLITGLLNVPGSRGKIYYVARREQDTLVNDYNAAVMLAWQANIDIQYIMSGELNVVQYITGYTTKTEKSKEGSRLQESLKTAATSTESFRALSDCLRMRNAGMLEIVDQLMGHDLNFFDSDSVFINSNDSEKRDRMVKSKKKREREKEAGTAKKPIYEDNQLDCYYPNRAAALEDFSLLNIQVYFKATAKGQGEDEDEEEQEVRRWTKQSDCPYDGLFNISSRRSPFYDHKDQPKGAEFPIVGYRKVHKLLNKPLVPRLYWPHVDETKEESREDYFRRLCLVFKPWRNEESIQDDGATYEETWRKWMESMEKNNDEGERQAAEDIRKIIQRQAFLLELDDEAATKRRERREMLEQLDVDEDAENGVETFDREVDVAEHQATLASLNAEQMQLFTWITDHVSKQEEWRSKKAAIENDRATTSSEKSDARRALGQEPGPLLLCVCGTAGCGKTHTINAIADELTLRYTTAALRIVNPAVVLCAPTGLAAVQIHGSTLHATLGIPVQQGKVAPMYPLRSMRLDQLRTTFKNVKLLRLRLRLRLGRRRSLRHLAPMANPPSSNKRKADQNRWQRECRARKKEAEDAEKHKWEPEEPRPTPLILDKLVDLRRQALHDPALKELLTPYSRIGTQRWAVIRNLEAALKKDDGIPSDKKTKQLDALRKRREAEMQDIVGNKDFCVMRDDINCHMAGMERTPDADEKAVLLRAQKICSSGRKIIPLCLASIERAAARLLEQATCGVAHPLGTSKREKVFRTITRMKYHVVRPRTVDPDARPLSEIYPKVYRDFFHLPEPQPALPSEENVITNLAAVLHASDLNGSQKPHVPEPDEEKMEGGEEYVKDDEVSPTVGRESSPSAMHSWIQGDAIQMVPQPSSAKMQCRARKFSTLLILDTLADLRRKALHDPELNELLMPYSRISTQRWSVIRSLEAALKNDEGSSSDVTRKALDALRKHKEAEKQETLRWTLIRNFEAALTKDEECSSDVKRRMLDGLRKQREAEMQNIVRNEDFSFMREEIECYLVGMERLREKAPAVAPTNEENMESEEEHMEVEEVSAAAGGGAPQGDYLRLPNYTGADCYASTAMHLIDGLPVLRDDFLTQMAADEACGVPISPPAQEMRLLLTRQKSTVVHLRTAYGALHRDGDDVEEFFSNLVNNLPIRCQDQLELALKIMTTCEGGHVSEVPDFRANTRMVPVSVQEMPLNVNNGNFDELCKQMVMNRRGTCDSPGCGRALVDVKTTISQFTRYAAFYVHRYVLERDGSRYRRELNIHGHNVSEGTTIFGKKMHLLCAAEYKSTHGLTGHYVVWRKTNPGWHVIDGAKPIKWQREVPSNLRNLSLMIFEIEP